LFQNPDDLAFRESGRLHAKFPVDPAARKFYLEHPLILGGTTCACMPSLMRCFMDVASRPNGRRRPSDYSTARKTPHWQTPDRG
ncbi:hypothetical protein, partial [Burkholderia gladioli]|uniref:hypothetical protein n=1 Tax=Burkholderia gladioli TaxID=28095 RepID=UPI001FC81702